MSELQKLYIKLNKVFFNDELPKTVRVHFGKLPGTIVGRTYYSKYWTPTEIVISNDLRVGRFSKYAACVLLHEMCHVCTRGDCEGPASEAHLQQKRRLMLEGAFDYIL